MAVSIRAVSGDAELLTRLEGEAFQASVHSLFTRVINLQCSASGRLFTLACAGVDNAPDTLVTGAASFDDCQLSVGDSVTREQVTLRVGSAM